jgi:release factor glutamine methyltransferase
LSSGSFGSGSSIASPARADAWTVETILRWATDDFRARGIDTARLDAELLLGSALSTTRIQLIIDSKRPLEQSELARFRQLVIRRRTFEPIAYILGRREFYGRVFRVDRRVLVPRPDTEALVDVALARTRHLSMSMRALDLCTGSGCVAVSLARERPTSAVLGTDVSHEALAVARENALRLGAYNAAFRNGDGFAAVPAGAHAPRFDLVTANAPYVSAADMATLMPDVRVHEPRLALDGGEDGLRLTTRIVAEAPAHLRAGGVLAVEVGAGQAPRVAELLRAAGFDAVELRRDYGGIERVVSGVLRER